VKNDVDRGPALIVRIAARKRDVTRRRRVVRVVAAPIPDAYDVDVCRCLEPGGAIETRELVRHRGRHLCEARQRFRDPRAIRAIVRGPPIFRVDRRGRGERVVMRFAETRVRQLAPAAVKRASDVAELEQQVVIRELAFVVRDRLVPLTAFIGRELAGQRLGQRACAARTAGSTRAPRLRVEHVVQVWPERAVERELVLNRGELFVRGVRARHAQ